MITGIKKLKTLTKHISCKRKGKFDGRNCNSHQSWDNEKCRCECKKRHICEKDYIWNPAPSSYKDGKYLASILYDSLVLNHLKYH